eukprot:scaffold37468_cov34-Prasinocladus_malaysianus.AAC.1
MCLTCLLDPGDHLHEVVQHLGPAGVEQKAAVGEVLDGDAVVLHELHHHGSDAAHRQRHLRGEAEVHPVVGGLVVHVPQRVRQLVGARLAELHTDAVSPGVGEQRAFGSRDDAGARSVPEQGVTDDSWLEEFFGLHVGRLVEQRAGLHHDHQDGLGRVGPAVGAGDSKGRPAAPAAPLGDGQADGVCLEAELADDHLVGIERQNAPNVVNNA